MTPNKSRGDVVDEVAALVDMPQTKVDAVLRAFEETIKRQASAGGETRIVGFGTFKVTHRAARTSRNPQTGEPIDVAARNAIRFLPGQSLKDAAASSLASSLADEKPAKKTRAKTETVAAQEPKVEAKAGAKKEKKPKKSKS